MDESLSQCRFLTTDFNLSFEKIFKAIENLSQIKRNQGEIDE
jgi:hypothetical protein